MGGQGGNSARTAGGSPVYSGEGGWNGGGHGDAGACGGGGTDIRISNSSANCNIGSDPRVIVAGGGGWYAGGGGSAAGAGGGSGYVMFLTNSVTLSGGRSGDGMARVCWGASTECN